MEMTSWGTKRTCANCAARFYDLNRGTGVCPKCDAPFDSQAITKRKRVRAVAAASAAAEAKKLEAKKLEAKAPESPKPAPGPVLGPDQTTETVAESAANGNDSTAADSLEKIESIDASDDDEEDEDNLIEDASELGEDADDVADVIGKVKDEEGSA